LREKEAHNTTYNSARKLHPNRGRFIHSAAGCISAHNNL
jgi:hypothetical protein